jgi:hypothetical protein
MAKMEPTQIDVPMTQPVVDTVSVTITPQAPAPAAVQTHPANRNPSEWRIEPLEGDNIRAVNNTSRDVFEGSFEDFNKILRG